MSSNIEDLLNSDDSDDEVCSEALGEIDLEQLLERDDDEDDCASPTTALIAQLKNKPLSGLDTHTHTHSHTRTHALSLPVPASLSLPAAPPVAPSFDPQVTALLEAERSPEEEEDAHSLEALLAEDALSPATANNNNNSNNNSTNNNTDSNSNSKNAATTSLSAKQVDSTPSSSSSSLRATAPSLSLPLSLSLTGSLALPLAFGSSAASASSEVPSTPPVMTDCPSLRLAEQREMRALQTLPSQASGAQADKGVAALPLRRHSLASSAASSLSTSSSAVLDECAAISGQFLKNAQYAQHGPGTASAICASHKFVAVGTTKGCVLVFDAQQELRRVLSSPAPCAPCPPIPNAAPIPQSLNDPSATQSPSSAESPTDSQTAESQKTESQAQSLSQVVTPMCVTSLDTLPDGSLLLSTHLCGDVVFWDTVRGTALKQVRDPSMSFSLSLSAAAALTHANNAMLRAALLPGLGFANLRLNHSLADSDSFVCITQNMRGTLNRVRLSRSLLSSWHCEVDCLISEEDHSHRTHTAGSDEKHAKKPSKGSLRTFSVLRPLSESLVPETLPRYLPRPVSDKTGEETLKEREYSDLRNYPNTLQVVALSFERETHVVQLSPDVKTLFRWPLSSNTPPQTHAQTETKTETDAQPQPQPQPQPQTEVCVDWTWHPLSVSPSVSLANARSGTEEDLDSESESETEADNDSNTESKKERKRGAERERAADPGVWSPLLTRVCGRTIETLAVRPMFTGYNTASSNNINSNNANSSGSAPPNASTPASDPTLTGATPAMSTRRSSLFALASQSLSVFAASVSDATQHTTPSLSSTVTGVSSTLTFDFQACQSVTLSPSLFSAEDEKLLRAQWLHATQLVALTQRSVLVLDASLSVIECAPLSVPLARSLSLPPMHTHNTPQCGYTHVAQHWADLRAQSVVVSRPQRELLLLSSLSLHRATPRSPFERAETLIRSGKWLEGLALVIDTLARCPLLLNSEKPRLEMYIINYANLAVKRDTHRPAALSSTLSSSKSAATNGNLAVSASSNKTHFSLVASVCVEYCVATRQLRLLFHELYELFRREGAQAALLEALEPSILTGDMRVLPRRVVREFLSLSLSQRRLRSVERSLIRLDPLSLQLSFVAAFCAQHALYAPLLYVYAHARNDFAAAAQLVLQDLLLCEESSEPTPSPSPVKSSAQSQKALSLSLSLSPATEQLTDGVYKLLLFLLFTFQGRVYPRGELFPPHNTHTQQAAQTAIIQNAQSARTLTDAPAQALQRLSSLLRFVCAETLSPLPALTQRPQPSERALSNFPALRVLCRVDAPATVYAVCEGLNALCTLLEKEREKERDSSSQRSRERDSALWNERGREPTIEAENETEQDDPTSVTVSAKKRFSLERQLVHCLHDLLSFCRHSDDAHSNTPRSHNASGSNISSLSLETLLFQQTHASLLVRLAVRVPLDLLDSLCRYCTAQPPQQRLHFERVLQRVAQRQARFHTPSALRRLFIERDFHFAALALLSEQYCGESTSTDVGLNAADAQTELRRALRHYIELAVVLERDRERDRDRERVPGWDLVFEFALSLSRTLSPAQSLDAQTQHSQLSTDSPLSPLTTHALSPSAQALLDGLKDAVLRETLSLCRVDVPRTAALALSLSLSLPAVVAQCAADGRTQYLLCTQLLRDLSNNARKGDSAAKDPTNGGIYVLHSSAAEALDVHTLTQYVRLLCVHDPEGVRPFLVTFQSFCALDDCLQAVRSAGLADAAAFLLERSGDSLGALSALLQDVCVRVRQARREIDSQLRSEARDALSAHSHSATPSHGHSQSQNNARVPLSQLLNRHSSQHTLTEALLRLPGCRALKRLTDCLSELCERQQQSHAQLFSHTLSESPQNAPTEESPAQDTWFKAFDHLLNERHMLKSGTISASSELLAQFLSALIQQFIVAMKNGIAPQQIMLRVVTHAAGANIRLGEFKDVMCSMLELSRNELAQNVCVRGIFTQDLVHFKKKKLERMRGFVYRSSDHQTPVAVLPPQSSSSEDGSPQRASSEVFLEALRGGRVKRHGVLSNRSWKLMDVKSIEKRAQDKKTVSLPITQVPICVADFGLTEPEIRRPGRVDVSRAVFAQNNASSWQ